MHIFRSVVDDYCFCGVFGLVFNKAVHYVLPFLYSIVQLSIIGSLPFESNVLIILYYHHGCHQKVLIFGFL